MNTFTSPCIDPRTGLIRFHLPLLHLIGNDHMGPALSLMLDYFPLETQPSLYGQGFRDTLSWFNPQTRQLQTDGGARFGLTRRDGEWAFLSPSPQHIKLATRQDNLWIYYRNGAIEIVSRSPQQPADDVLWRLQTRLSAGGNALTLSWGWRQHLALLISVADDDGELLRTSLRLTSPAGEKARARMDAEAGPPPQAEFIPEMEANARSAAKTETDSPAQAGFIADIEANARGARYTASEALELANPSAQARANADAKTDTEPAIDAELVFTCFPASQAPVTTLLTVAGGRLIQLSIGPKGERILCRIAYHPTLGVIQQVKTG